VLDSGSDRAFVDTGGHERGGEVHRLLGRAALAVDRGGRGLDRQPLLKPGVAPDVEALRAELLHAARHHVADLHRVDAAAPDHLGVGETEQIRRMHIPVPAFLGMPTPDRSADGVDDHHLSAVAGHLSSPLGSI
jgi:hypothetical protein